MRSWAHVAGLGALVLLALSLRGPVSSVGPLLDDLRDDVGLTPAAAAVLPALPLLCFGLLAPAAPVLGRRLGLHRAVLLGSAVLVAGLALRSLGLGGLFAGTVLLGAGIAVVNVLLPAVVKADFPDRLSLATALTTSSMALSASLGAGLAQPLRGVAGGAVPSLAMWLVPAVVGLLCWTGFTRGSSRGAAPPPTSGLAAVLRDPVGLSVTVFFGLQALSFYTVLAWLPSVLRAAGVSGTEAGAMLAVLAALGVPVAFVVPRMAVRRPDQRVWVLVAATPTAIGLLGLLAAPAAAPWLWSVLIGVGTGAAFPLALTFVVLRSCNAAQAARLSAAAQGAGYVLCAAGPFGIGLLHAATGTWTPSLLVLVGLLCVQVLVGRAAARDRLVRG